MSTKFCTSREQRSGNSPLAFLWAPQNSRDDAQSCKPLMCPLNALVLVRAVNVATIASVLRARTGQGQAERALRREGLTHWSCKLFFLYAFEISDVEAVCGTSSHE